MKIYTKTGDAGETGLFGGPRVSKDHPRIDAYGEVDELNSILGFARTQNLPDEIDSVVGRIQGELFDVGAELATPDPPAHGTELISDAHIRRLEDEIDRFESDLEPLKNFILPGGSPGAASLQIARSVCRRAERKIISLNSSASDSVSPNLICYINRLSDHLFVLARSVNRVAGVREPVWVKDGNSK